jgi:5-hydroxyisourate hydrolase
MTRTGAPPAGLDSWVSFMSVYAQALDLVYGRPAAGVPSRLERQVAEGQRLSDGWLTIAQAVTGSDGFLHEWTADRLGQGSYRIVFDSDSYFANLGMSVAYFELSYAFRLRDEADNCYLQAMLGTHSYSIYSGTRG